MKRVDNRFNQNQIKQLIGKVFNRIKHDHFSYTNSVTGTVGLMIDNKSYAIINDFEDVDYLDWDNEACVCKIISKPWNEIESYIEGENQITTNINEIVKSITIVNDHIESFVNGKQDYDWWETRAIIFNLESHQISFTKKVCFFSMEIEINKGYNLIDKIEKTDKFYSEHSNSDEQTIVINREVIEVKK